MALQSKLAHIAAALAFALTAPAIAQTPAPRTDIPALLKEAQADPAIKAALAAKDRPTDARLRDKARHVDLILKAADAKPGMRVLDVGAGGGYLALLFSSLVGDSSGDGGHVDIHNTPGWINQFPSMDPDFQKQRIKRPNIGYITEPWNGIKGKPNSYDIIVLGQVYHDVGLEGGDYAALNKTFFDLLKPGGRLVIEDHDAINTMHFAQQLNLHRISNGDVTGLVLRAGFEHADMILIESEYDDRRFNVFRPGVRGRTDRFIATFEKPADGKPLR
jgi:predicted methyltransferase